jgi:DMSO/TMAO reductase YedYZ molybdopterin-dependent catalytic subunit
VRRLPVAGAIAAAAALATTELVGAVVDPHRPTVVAAVASRLVVLLSGPLRGPAISVFGTNDKAALIVGIVLVALALGSALARATRGRDWVFPAGLAVAGVAGVTAAWGDPLASAPWALLACAAGVVAGESTRRLLIAHAAVTPAALGRDDRRRFLAGMAVAVPAVAGIAAAGRVIRSRTGRRQRTDRLPAADRSTPIPADSFAVPGLTPYITTNERFYRIDTAVFVPDVDVDAWTLRVEGLVDHPQTYTFDDLLAMPLVEEPVTLACVSNDVGGHLIGNARWRGVPLADLLTPAGVRPEATQIVARSVDGFTIDVATESALDGRVALVALGMNGELLPARHGYPARLLVAGFYGYASGTKWLSSIELTRREDHDSYWVDRGWDKDGPIKIQSRVDVPGSGDEVSAGPVRLAGVAWAPPVGVARVEVSVDHGPWVAATLGTVASPNTWVQWIHDTELAPGSHLCAVRATNRDGVVQVEDPSTPEPSGATGYHYRGFTAR